MVQGLFKPQAAVPTAPVQGYSLFRTNIQHFYTFEVTPAKTTINQILQEFMTSTSCSAILQIPMTHNFRIAPLSLSSHFSSFLQTLNIWQFTSSSVKLFQPLLRERETLMVWQLKAVGGCSGSTRKPSPRPAFPNLFSFAYCNYYPVVLR